jgi:hypothetical protein
MGVGPDRKRDQIMLKLSLGQRRPPLAIFTFALATALLALAFWYFFEVPAHAAWPEAGDNQGLQTMLSRFGCKSEHRIASHEVTVTCNKPLIEELLPEIREIVPEVKAIPPFVFAMVGGNDVIVSAILQVSAIKTMQNAFANGDEGPVHVVGLVAFYDTYGNRAARKALEFYMNRDTYVVIKWDHFDPSNRNRGITPGSGELTAARCAVG